MKAHISLHICAVSSGPLFPTYRLMDTAVVWKKSEGTDHTAWMGWLSLAHDVAYCISPFLLLHIIFVILCGKLLKCDGIS